MRDLASKLKYAGIDLVHGYQARRSALESELGEARIRVLTIEAQLEATNATLKRYNTFPAEFEGELRCPKCWMANERLPPLKPQPSQTDDDHFRCSECGYEFVAEKDY